MSIARTPSAPSVGKLGLGSDGSPALRESCRTLGCEVGPQAMLHGRSAEIAEPSVFGPVTCPALGFR